MNFPSNLPQELYTTRLIDRLAYAHDASLYRVVPEAVARPRNEEDVIRLLNFANVSKTPVTFRTAGTSLSGQSIGPGIIVETVKDWKNAKVLDDGKYIRLQPGVIGSHANKYLSSSNRKIGPDPASISACMIGGIAANNASGMVCGTEFNAYHTMKSLRFILPNGRTYDTARKENYQKFVENEPELSIGLEKCRKLVLDNDHLMQKIRRKYRIKNTMGYSLNALLDFEHPLDIFSHLIIGSEGTLAFISDITLKTIPDSPFKTTGLLLFDDMETACSTIPYFIEQGVNALEIMDYASLSTVKYLPKPLFNHRKLLSMQGGLLCEFQGDSRDQMLSLAEKTRNEVGRVNGHELFTFTTEAIERENLWKLRKGLYPTVGSLRQSGTSVITEDICVHYSDLPEMIAELQHIFSTWRFNDAVIFGHAKDGNLHFVSSLDMNSKEGVKQLDGMMQDLSSITIVKFDGSLKAEHGTGRNMAPFVETEWGGELYDIMWQIKSLADPNNILNPGVLLNKNKDTHITDLKPIPPVNVQVDLCVECGFCEAVCPSKEITMTPRHRIVLAREMVSEEWSSEEVAVIQKAYSFSGIDTCATDGLCAISCPVNIDTGLYIKELRSVKHSMVGEIIAVFCAENFSLIQSFVRGGLRTGKILGSTFMSTITKLSKNMGWNSMPQWNPFLPGPADKTIHNSSGSGDRYIYFPSCIHRTMGSSNKNKSMVNMLMEIAPLLGVELIIPDSINNLCCGMPFSSKGFTKAHSNIFKKTMIELYAITEQGKIPVLVDMSPCFYHFISLNGSLPQEIRRITNSITFIDIIQLLINQIESIPDYERLPQDILVHITCSSQKVNQSHDFINLLKKIGDNVITQENLGCCGAAGDRGLLVPELTESASMSCAGQYPEYSENAVGVSTSRMCELSMSQATGVSFYSIIELFHEYLFRRHEN